MIRVAICDDDKHMQESLSKYLLDYSIQCDREIDHSEFDTCEKLMDEYLKGNSFDVILLDIEFKNNDEKQMNGIELGKRLRGLYANDNTAIVYVTSYGEYAIDSIKIRPYDYIKILPLPKISLRQQKVAVGHCLLGWVMLLLRIALLKVMQ